VNTERVYRITDGLNTFYLLFQGDYALVCVPEQEPFSLMTDDAVKILKEAQSRPGFTVTEE
jgi:hypothetical protein